MIGVVLNLAIILTIEPAVGNDPTGYNGSATLIRFIPRSTNGGVRIKV